MGCWWNGNDDVYPSPILSATIITYYPGIEARPPRLENGDYSSKLTFLLTPWSRVHLEKLTGFAANQEIPRILRTPKVHHSTHKHPPSKLYANI